jgi:hypothetical protein
MKLKAIKDDVISPPTPGTKKKKRDRGGGGGNSRLLRATLPGVDPTLMDEKFKYR